MPGKRSHPGRDARRSLITDFRAFAERPSREPLANCCVLPAHGYRISGALAVLSEDGLHCGL